jgi:hypothetical protein
MRISHGRNVQSFPIKVTISHDLHRVRYDHKYLSTTLNMPYLQRFIPYRHQVSHVRHVVILPATTKVLFKLFNL